MNRPSADAAGALAGAVDASLIDRLTCALIEAPSVNPGGTEQAAVDVLAGACRELGFSVDLHEAAPGRPNLTATIGDGAGPGLLLLGHSDVVPPGPGWTADPFVVRRDGDLIIGRGAADMKGGVAAAVAALAVLSHANEHGIALSGPVTLAVTVDEEESNTGARALVDAWSSRPAGGPSYRGCIVAEPTNLQVVRGCRGASQWDITITGRAAHSGRPADGVNAIGVAAELIALLEKDQTRLATIGDPLLGHGTWNVGTIEGGEAINIVAPGCRLGVDRRLMPGESVGAVADELRSTIDGSGICGDGASIELAPKMELPGFVTAADHPLVAATVAALGDEGVSASVGGWTAACDGGYISRDLGVPTVVMGPGDLSGQAHRPDESVSLAELTTAARAYVRAAVALLSAP
ncbi:MAG: M20 family metallopeptidase [Gordonia sp. (in: high G+C Gram-positive bacteria)]